MPHHFNVLALGHSFTRRLRDWCICNGIYNLNLNSSQMTVFVHGIGGAKIVDTKSIWRELDLISNLQIDRVVLDLGSNDLCSPNRTPLAVAEAILSFARLCTNHGASSVCIMGMLPRSSQDLFNRHAPSGSVLWC